MKQTLATFLFLFLFFNAYAQDTLEQAVRIDSGLLVIDTVQKTYNGYVHVQVLKDPTHKYKITDFLAEENLKLFKSLAEFDKNNFNQEAPPWIKISVQNNIPDQELWAFQLWDYADSTLIYVINEDSRIDTFKRGRLISYEKTESDIELLNTTYKNQNPIFLKFKKGERKEFFYQTYPKASYIYPQLRPIETLYEKQYNMHFRYMKATFFLGLIWMLFAYNLIIYLFYKNKGYLYLALYIFCFTIPGDYETMSIISEEWFYNDLLLFQIDKLIFIPSIFIFLTLFMREYLNTKKLYPKVDLIFKWMIGISFVHFALTIGSHVINDDLHTMVPIWRTIIQVVIQTILFIIASRLLFKYKARGIKFLIFSIAVLIFFFLLLRLPQIFGWTAIYNALNIPLYPINIGHVGLLLQIIIWIMGLGAKSREVEQDKELLEEKDAFKSQFFVNISHEFRTPLTLVLGPIQQIIDKTTDKKDKELLRMAHRNANRQLQLINELLDLSKLEANKMKLQAYESDFVPVLRGIFYSYHSLAEQREIVLEMNNPSEPVLLYFDQEKIEKIFYNLLSNAFKFTSAGEKISVSLVQNKKSISVKVSDTGTGISKEKLENIFDRFFQAASSKETYYEGSGIGLTLTKELVELHHGKISVTSELGKGTTFHLEFPLGKKHLQTDEIVENLVSVQSVNPNPNYVELKENLTVIPIKKTAKSSTLPRLLIVEDNKDMRAFIRQKLENDYQIIEAFDGQEGIEKAIEHQPDLIISDVMMPKKNGYEVCKTLKTDVRTSHIPVVLLTAKAAQEEKIEGLETGADDYLTKPFDAKELLIRVQNLIAIREQLRQRFAAAINLKPSEVTTNSIDAEFLQNAMQVVEANMESEDFNIEAFTKEIGMGRSTLNRKLKSLTNQTTNQFIQAARLNRAADLLRQQSGTVAEIAFQTGSEARLIL